MRFVQVSIIMLSAILLVQVWPHVDSAILGPSQPQLGDLVPDVPMILASRSEMEDTRRLTDLLDDSSGCALIVLSSAYCSYSHRHLVTWNRTYDTWSDSVGEKVYALWLFKEAPEIVESFSGGRTLTNASMWSLGSGADRAWRRLGVTGTPTTYLVDRFGRIRGGAVGPNMPSASLASEVCAS